MTTSVTSKNCARIRLTDERWSHITEEHGELVGSRLDVMETVFRPDRIVAGNKGELLAIRQIGHGKSMVVVYREVGTDGFVITAFLTSRSRSLDKRKQIWP